MSGRVVFQHHGMAVLLQWWLNGQDVRTAILMIMKLIKMSLQPSSFLITKLQWNLKRYFWTHPSKQQRSFGCHVEITPKCPRHHPERRKKKVEASRSYCCSNNSRSRCRVMKKCCLTSELERYQKKHFLHPFFLMLGFHLVPQPIKSMCPYDWIKLFPITFKWMDQFCSSWPRRWSSVSYWCQNYK